MCVAKVDSANLLMLKQFYSGFLNPDIFICNLHAILDQSYL